ncbi:hypothetical protein [Paraburkholderia aromaticivorans]|uniref:hypothetical protein n=1 Tax=Paraburkholderia aromaticivorans TaxID=2026199 RepID=UPI001456222E|nr:hypothetical protein [Paraburkholderia aromaticivorans]
MSDRHASALRSSLIAGGNHRSQSAVPNNPQRTISRSTKDVSLGIDYRHNPDEAAEREYVKRKTALKPNGTASSTGMNAGAFDKLRRQVREHVAEHGELTKAVPHTPGDYSIEQAYADLKSVPLPSKARTAGASKALGKAMGKVARSMGDTKLAKSLEAGYGSDSANLTGGSALRRQAVSKRIASTTVGGDPKPAPKSTLMTKSQCQAAALKGLDTGKLTASQCQHIDVALSMDRRIDDTTMATLRELHEGN